MKNLWKKLYSMVILVGVLLIPILALAEKDAENADYIWASYKGVSQFEKKGKVGLMDEEGNVLIPARYDEIEVDTIGESPFLQAWKEGELTYYLQKTWEPLFAVNRQWEFWDSLSKVEKDEDGMYLYPLQYAAGSQSWLFITEEGKILGGKGWDKACEFSEGFAVVAENGKYGYIDKQGEIAIPLEWDDAYPFKEGKAAVERGGEWWFINHQGERGSKKTREEILKVTSSLYYYSKWDEDDINGGVKFSDIDEKYYIVYKNGDKYPFPEGTIRKEEYGSGDSSWFLYDRLVVQNEQRLYGVIDKKGNWVLEPVWDDISLGHTDKIFAVEKDGKWGFVNEKGEALTQRAFNSAGYYGIALAGYQGKGFCMNENWEPLNNSYIKSFAIDAPPVE